MRGAPQLHTLIIDLGYIRDLQVLLSLPALKRLRLLEDYRDEEQMPWEQSSCLELVRRTLPNLESLESMHWDLACEWSSSGLTE